MNTIAVTIIKRAAARFDPAKLQKSHTLANACPYPPIPKTKYLNHTAVITVNNIFNK